MLADVETRRQVEIMLRLDLAELRIDKARTCVGGFEVGATLIVDRQQDAVAIAVRQIGGRTVSFELRRRSEEHTSELQSLMRISYAVFCLKKNKKKKQLQSHT